MNTIDSRHFIEELRFDIKENDLIKARLVLSHLLKIDESTRKLAMLELARADDAFSMPLIIATLATHPDLSDECPDLREILYSKVLDNADLFISLMRKEPKRESRVLFADIAGEIRLEGASSILVGIINEEQDEEVLKGAIRALGMIGDSGAVTPISEYLYSGSVELTIAAIYALGNLGTPTAIQRLSEKLGADSDLDLMIMGVFAGSQSPESIEKLNDTLSSQHARLRNIGKQRIIEMGVKAVPTLMKNLLHDDPDLLIHTLNVLGDIGDGSAIPAIRKLLFNEPKDPNVRFAGYEALGMMPVEKGAFALAQGLRDPEGNVRAAAAGAIDRNYNTVLAAGIKNMVRDDDEESVQITQTLINSKCDSIFIDLVEEEGFKERAVSFLCDKAHPDIRVHFVALLNENDYKVLADRISKDTKAQVDTKLKVFAVDDSKMILNIYRGVLHNLGCSPILFEFPKEAIEKVKDEKPDIVFTDLNMPDISGIELTRQMREVFDKDKMPIVMVTTQNEATDNEAAYAAGINAILQKPFSEETLGKVMAELSLKP